MERENNELKAEAEAIFGPLEQQLRDLSSSNARLEKRLRGCKDENRELKNQLAAIEAEVEEMTARGVIPSKADSSLGQSKNSMIKKYEQQLEERENEIRLLTTQNRNLETDLRHLERKVKMGQVAWSPVASLCSESLTERVSLPINDKSGSRWHTSLQQQTGTTNQNGYSRGWSSKGDRSQYVALNDHLRTRLQSPLEDITDSLNRPTDENAAALDKFKQVD